MSPLNKKLQKLSIYIIYALVVCLSFCLLIDLYPINAKTTELIGSEFRNILLIHEKKQ